MNAKPARAAGRFGNIHPRRTPPVKLALQAIAIAVLTLSPASLLAAPDAIEAFRPTGEATFDHSAFDALLQRHVKPDGEGYNRVDYAALKGEHAALDAYLDRLAAADPTTLSRDAAHAWWINLYNAKTLDVVLDAYPVASIKDVDLGGSVFRSGPWFAPVITVNGKALTLDNVEHNIVRAIFDDPMSHYGLNCASYSCPNLMPRAYTGANVNAQLWESGRQYVAHPRGLRVENGRITASRIYKWYADDFGGSSAPVDHWLSLATPEKAAAIRAATMGRHQYDWSLNDAKPGS